MSGGVIALIVVGILVIVIGAFAAIAISSVRRFIAASKTAEAKNTIGAIAREAERAYENEPHRLCGSAKPVPADIPKATKYMASSADYDTGSETEGWKCLKHASSGPSYYQYEYRVGGDYKGASRGAPDPGPDGFEASAEGDLDGDGVTSLFVITGKVDPKTHTVTVNPQIFESNELE